MAMVVYTNRQIYALILHLFNNKRCKKVHEEGFEPSHLTIVGLKSTALDHSAIRAFEKFNDIFGS